MSSSRRTALLAGVLVMAAGMGLFYWNNARMKQLLEAPQRVAVLPFENHSGDGSLDWLEPLVPYAIARQMEGLPKVTVFAARDANEASALGATRIVSGFLTRRGKIGGISLRVEDARGHSLLAARDLEAQSREMTPLLGEVAVVLASIVRPNGRTGPLEVHGDAAGRLFAEGLNAKDSALASARFEAATQADPDCGWCWLAWAQRLSTSGSRDSVLQVLAESRKAGTKLTPLSRARLDLMEAALRADLPARRAALERLVQAAPSDVEAMGQLGQVCVVLRQFNRAEAVLRQAVATEPGRGDLWNSFGYALAYLGRYRESGLALEEYERTEPRSPNPPDSRGEVAMMAGQFSEAAKLFRQSYERDQNFNRGAALEKAALCLWLKGDKKESGELLERYLAARAQAGDPAAELTRARWEYLYGLTDNSKQRLRHLAASPENPLAGVAGALLSLRLLAEGDEAGARKAIQAARGVAGNRAQLQFLQFVAAAVENSGPAEARALGLTARGDWKSAAAAWQESLKTAAGGEDGPQRELLALSLVLAGRPAEGKQAVSAGWPLLQEQQVLLYDFLIYPNLFYTRAEIAQVEKNASEAQRNFDLFLQYSGNRPDRFGQLAKARGAARL